MRLLFILLICPILAFGQSTSYVEQNISIELDAGWNMFGYSCYDPMDLVEAFSPIVDKLIIVKDNDGNAYLSEYEFNGIGNLELHQGYQIKLTEAITDFQFCQFIVPIDTPFDCYVIDNDFAKFLSDYYPEIESLVVDSCLNTIAANNVYDLNTDGIPHILNDMDGLQYFTNMSEMGLFLSDENLTSLPDLSSMKNLWHLQIGESDYLTSLPELSSLNNLMELSIWDNDALTVIPDLSSLTNLVELNIWGNDSLKCVMGYPEHLIREEHWSPVCSFGCMDSTACNYNELANLDDGSCEYAEEGFDCEANEITYQVGDLAQGGIIFYVDETGKHGLVATLEDLGSFEWGCYEESVNGADGTSIGTGYQNTLDIVNQGCTTENGGVTAAQAALDAEINGYSDWYLPSFDELKEMYYTIGNSGSEGDIGGFGNIRCWTSTNINFLFAWDFDFIDGQGDSYKNYPLRVIPIRAFGYTLGCKDETACNYNPEASMADGSCEYPELGYDCEGNLTEYIVGMQADGGIVFYVDSAGERGLIAALEDLGSFEWGCYEESVNGADGTSIGTGYQNTIDIVNQGCSTYYGGISAAQAASDAEINGYSDWYIPSRDELLEMYYTIGIGGSEGNLGGFDTDASPYYWSSSESSNYGASLVDFRNSDGYTAYGSKDETESVRPIRAFGYTQGCMDETACNYNPEANMSDGSCEYVEEGYDCEPNEITYQVGDLAQGGIIFYVDETGQHGLVAATEDLTDGATSPYGWDFNGYEWGCHRESVNGADGQAIGTGYQNTLDIVNQGCTTGNGGITAAQAASEAEINGYSDWYLPSKDELLEMYSTIGNGGSEGNIGGFVDDGWPYYSSSETNDGLNAWVVFFYYGSTSTTQKLNTTRVRVIRAF